MSEGVTKPAMPADTAERISRLADRMSPVGQTIEHMQVNLDHVNARLAKLGELAGKVTTAFLLIGGVPRSHLVRPLAHALEAPGGGHGKAKPFAERVAPVV